MEAQKTSKQWGSQDDVVCIYSLLIFDSALRSFFNFYESIKDSYCRNPVERRNQKIDWINSGRVVRCPWDVN